MLELMRIWCLRTCRRLEAMLLNGVSWAESAEFVAGIKQIRLVAVGDDAAMATVIVQLADGSHRALCVFTELERP